MPDHIVGSSIASLDGTMVYWKGPDGTQWAAYLSNYGLRIMRDYRTADERRVELPLADLMGLFPPKGTT